MNVERALMLRQKGILPADAHVSAECRVNSYGGAWLIVARWFAPAPNTPVEHKRILTQYDSPFVAARWVNAWDQAISSERAAKESLADEVENIARALYVASGGSLMEHPWPCKRADHYRNLAQVALDNMSEVA